MALDNYSDITRLLKAWRNGDQESGERLMELVYDELKRIAAAFLAKERSDHTLRPTALVNETYIRLVDGPLVDWKDRAHFFGIAARTMRQILIAYARARTAEKRGGDVPKVVLSESDKPARDSITELVLLDEGLKELEKIHARKAKVVEIRYFGGLNIDETAEVLNISRGTVKRDWESARAWLFRYIYGGKSQSDSD